MIFSSHFTSVELCQPPPPLLYVSSGRKRHLDGATVLVVEDDYAIAEELHADLNDAGMHVLQPVPTLENGYAALAMWQLDIAVLDINLRGHPVYPLADALIRRGVLVAFYTGYDRELLPERLRHLPCIIKPAGAEAIIAALRTFRTPARPRISVTGLLPDLRVFAASLTGEVKTGDKLVETALEMANTFPSQRPRDTSLKDWLRTLVQCAANESGYRKSH